MSSKITTFFQHMVTPGRPREDYSAHDEASGAFAIADGVTLWEGIEYEGNYPKDSGAFAIAKLFSDSFVDFYKKNNNGALKEAVAEANRKAAEANSGRSKCTVLKDHRGLFATTAAIAHIKGNVLEWGQICDAGIAVIGKDDTIRLKQDSHKNYVTEWPKDIDRSEPNSATLFARTTLANAIGKDKQKIGYGVITGEKEAEDYVEYGTLNLEEGDTIVLYADGFSPYFQLPEFLQLLASREDIDVEKEIEKLVEKQTQTVQELLKGKSVDMKKGYTSVTGELKKLLGDKYEEMKWCQEKSLIIIKV